MRSPRRPAQDLRFAIDCLPRDSRVAMLDGIEQSTIIVGAYTDPGGGVCPMLAAHRRGGRNDLASFARAWDRYAAAGKRSRAATERELRTLKGMLEASLVNDEGARGELAQAITELEQVKARRAAEQAARARHGDRDRSPELRRRSGWAWLRVFRRYDEYKAALERVERAEQTVERREPELV